MKTRIATAIVVFTLANLGWAQSVSNNTTNFSMIGIAHGQTLQINVVAFPPNPCFAQLGFQDINGNPVGTTLNVAL